MKLELALSSSSATAAARTSHKCPAADQHRELCPVLHCVDSTAAVLPLLLLLLLPDDVVLLPQLLGLGAAVLATLAAAAPAKADLVSFVTCQLASSGS